VAENGSRFKLTRVNKLWKMTYKEAGIGSWELLTKFLHKVLKGRDQLRDYIRESKPQRNGVWNEFL
jgi:hypothetical protein